MPNATHVIRFDSCSLQWRAVATSHGDVRVPNTLELIVMNKTNKKHSARETSGSLSFKRETVRNLSADEIRQTAGGRICLPDSCGPRTCPNSVCTITVDSTL
jgi:hypothetical protein